MPEGAHYLPVTSFIRIRKDGLGVSSPAEAYTFYPACVFEWTEDHAMWRHMQNYVPNDVRGLTGRTMVLRTAATVGNYDYVTDIKFREDGEIEVKAVFAGCLETRRFDPAANPEERKFRASCA